MAKKNKSALDYNFGDAAKDIKSLFTEKTALVTSVTNNLTELSKQYDKENTLVDGVIGGWKNWQQETIESNETFKQMAHYSQTFNNAVTLNIPKSIGTFKKAQDASRNNKMAKTIYNTTKVGDYKEKFAGWNDVNDAGITTAIGAIPVIGNIWNFNESLSVLLHNRGQIADDLYRSQLNPLMTEEYQAEALVMQQQGDYQTKKLKTLQMRKEFWEKELKTFNWNEGNKYYEEDRTKYNQILFDIETFKSQQGEFAQSRAPKPEQEFYDHLQTFRDAFLLSPKTQSDYDVYKASIDKATATITRAQPEFYHVKTVFYENLDKDFYDMERDQSAARRALSDLIRDYAKGAGSITKKNYLKKLNEMIETGRNSSDPEVQDVGRAASSQIYFIEQAEQNKIDKKAAEDKVIADREARDRYNALKAQSDAEIKGVELETDSLEKYLKLNDLKYNADKDLINYRIEDEKIKNEILLDLEQQRIDAAYSIEYEYTQKHNALYAGLTEGASSVWDNFIVGSRKAKNDMDKLWLGFRNPMLKKLGSEIGDTITNSDFFKELFVGKKDTTDKRSIFSKVFTTDPEETSTFKKANALKDTANYLDQISEKENESETSQENNVESLTKTLPLLDMVFSKKKEINSLDKSSSLFSDTSSLLSNLFSSGSNSSTTGAKKETNWFQDALGYASMILPFLAEGGIVTKPTLVMAGEAGPEGIIPLDQMNSQKVIYVQPVIQGNFDVSMHKLQLKLDQNKKMMEELY